jgi:predicted dithiol-disulfide oxidoreductase (DUF899 family)
MDFVTGSQSSPPTLPEPKPTATIHEVFCFFLCKKEEDLPSNFPSQKGMPAVMRIPPGPAHQQEAELLLILTGLTLRPSAGGCSRELFRGLSTFAVEIMMSTRTLKPADQLAAMAENPFPGESDEYRVARRALMAEEIEFRRHMTRVVEQRRALPSGPTVTKDYRFHDDKGADVGLADLFGDKGTLVTYFWMYGPQRQRPCPMCTNWLGSVNGNATDIAQLVSLKIFGRSSVERQIAFAQERGWHNLDFVQTIGDDYANDLGLMNPDGTENPALIVYRRDGDKVRLFWSGAMTLAMADPGQDPRDAPDIASLWSILDLTPEGRGTDWYPKLEYAP